MIFHILVRTSLKQGDLQLQTIKLLNIKLFSKYQTISSEPESIPIVSYFKTYYTQLLKMEKSMEFWNTKELENFFLEPKGSSERVKSGCNMIFICTMKPPSQECKQQIVQRLG